MSGVSTSGAWLLFRIDYYADLLPNTYYLKDETNLTQGFLYLLNTFGAQGLGVVLVGLGGLALLVVSRARRTGQPLPELHPNARMLMLAAALVSTVYVWRAGGDMLYFRFLAFPVVLALCSLHGVGERSLDRVALPRRELSYPLLGALAAMLLLLGYPSQLREHPLTARAVHGETMRKVDGISDASWHRYHPELRMSSARAEQDEQLRERYQAHSDEGKTRFVAEGLCVRAYLAFDENIVHSWGLTEPILARSNVQEDRPGHRYGLLPLARDLQRARQRAGGPGEPGMLRRASERGFAAPWIEKNLAAIERIEHKMYNQHHLWENLSLALTPVATIDVRSQ